MSEERAPYNIASEFEAAKADFARMVENSVNPSEKTQNIRNAAWELCRLVDDNPGSVIIFPREEHKQLKALFLSTLRDLAREIDYPGWYVLDLYGPR